MSFPGRTQYSFSLYRSQLTAQLRLPGGVFGGEIADILALALKQRCYQDGLGIDPNTLKQQFTLHLHRGIGYLAGDSQISQIEDLVALNLAGE